jgi:hypothetical protein
VGVCRCVGGRKGGGRQKARTGDVHIADTCGAVAVSDMPDVPGPPFPTTTTSARAHMYANPHAQAMDRAHRLGQRRTVHVYRLLMRDTLEERVLGLQVSLAHKVLSITDWNSLCFYQRLREHRSDAALVLGLHVSNVSRQVMSGDTVQAPGAGPVVAPEPTENVSLSHCVC